MRSLRLVCLFLIVLILLFNGANGQQTMTVRQCGTGPRYQKLNQAVLDKLKLSELEVTKVFGLIPQEGTPTYPLINVPVVVHVLYNPKTDKSVEIGKIDAQQVQSQIDALNRDYNPPAGFIKSNAVPLAFRNAYASPMITFTLAKTEWVATQTKLFTDADEAKQAPSGVVPLAPQTALNIYVVPALKSSDGTSILGYSSWPGEPEAIDGVVIQYQAFGTTGSANAPFNLGHTTSHEVGHWFNLHHLWGDKPDNPSCSEDDGVADTPKQDGPTLSCPVPQTRPKACKNGLEDRMYPNFMDYSPDACMSMFTVDQVIRMREAIKTLRPKLGQ